jgi:cation:H+ antiporter
VLGLSSVIKPLPFQPSGNLDIMMVIIASILLFVFLFVGKKHQVEKWQGIFFVILYVVYIVFLVMRG